MGIVVQFPDTKAKRHAWHFLRIKRLRNTREAMAYLKALKVNVRMQAEIQQEIRSEYNRRAEQSRTNQEGGQ